MTEPGKCDYYDVDMVGDPPELQSMCCHPGNDSPYCDPDECPMDREDG